MYKAKAFKGKKDINGPPRNSRSIMASTHTTLLEYLITPNPQINSENSWKGSNTKSTGSMWLSYSELNVWEEFNFNSLNELYKDTLQQLFNTDDLPSFNQKLPYHITEIRSENTLNSLLIRWNNAVVSAALAASQSRSLNKRKSPSPREEIFMACGCQATILPRQDLKLNKKLPDWAGIMKGNTHKLPEKNRIVHANLLPGDTKLSTKWNSKSIEKNKINSENKAPINQLLTYCVIAKVRYGYIITQEELVVFRVSETHRSGTPAPPKSKLGPQDVQIGKSKYKHTMEYKAIPWKPDGGPRSDGLTVNLALWGLHMLAAQERSLLAVYSKLVVEKQDSIFSSFATRASKLDDSGSDIDLPVSQLSSFNSKRRREDDDHSEDDVVPERADKRAGKRAGRRKRDLKLQDVSMSFGSQASI